MSDLRVPKYRKHKQSGQAIVTLTDGAGGRRDVLLGKHGSKASKDEYSRVIAEWLAKDKSISLLERSRDHTITELVSKFWPWVEQWYRHTDGSPTSEVGEFKYSLRPLNFLFGHTLACDFGPLALKAVRQLMVDGYTHPKYGEQGPLARGVINKRISRIKRLFAWAIENEHLRGPICQELAAVKGLPKGRSNARETAKVRPVSRAVVDATLPLLRLMIADMVRIQLATGMRSGELVIMRACDIDMSGPIWLYRPSRHKSAHRDLERVIAIGPHAQAIIKRWLLTDTQAYLFSPKRSREEQDAARRAKRVTPRWPSHVRIQEKKRKAKKKRWAGEHYTAGSFNCAVTRAIKKHNDGKPAGEQIPHWHLHQLRHLRALELRREVGLEAARAVLGHQEPTITAHYAGLDVGTATEVMGRLG